MDSLLPPALNDQLARFSEFGTAILNNANVYTAAPLHHYTSAAGAFGILGNSNVRLTHYADLQDTYEVSYGRRCAEALLLAAEDGSSPVTDAFCRVTRENLQEAFEPFGFYVASFTTEENGPRHWNDYANQCRGFRISFAPSFFGHTKQPVELLKPTEKIVIARVFYGDRAIAYRQQKIIDRALSVLRMPAVQQAINSQPFYRVFMREMTVNTAVILMFNSLCAKQTSYDFEKEIRLIMLGDKNLLEPHEQQGLPKRPGQPYSRFIPASFQPWPVDVSHIGVGSAASAADIAQLHSVIEYASLSPDEQRRIIR